MNVVRPRGFPAVIAIDADMAFRRLLEIVPGGLSWLTLVSAFSLAVVRPSAVAVVLVLYDFYWLIRAIYIGIHLAASYRMLRRMQGFGWAQRLPWLSDPSGASAHARARARALESRLQTARSRRARSALRAAWWQEQRCIADIERIQAVPDSARPRWEDILHVVILPTYEEPLPVIAHSIEALAQSDYPKERLWVVVAFEERAGAHAEHTRHVLTSRYAHAFGKFLTTMHPDGIVGERRVKSANASFAAHEVHRLLLEQGIPLEWAIVSNFDSDTVVSREYFAALTYTYLTTPDRLRCSYQPLPLYHNNIWTAPAFTRVIATNSTFWQIIQSARPERLVTYSSHAMPFRALVDVGFWDPSVVSEDSRIFWQAYVHYDGAYRVVPLYATLSMDATQAPTLVQSFANQYRQMRRWAWGIENFPFIAQSFLRSSVIPVRQRVRRIFWVLEAWHSWATSSIILAGLGWALILFGNAEFQRTVLAFNLPRMSRTLLTIGMAGLVLNGTLSFLLLPKPPPGTPKHRFAWMGLQWLLTPLTALLLGAMPALDAQTRLMFGKYLGFWVTPKVRPEHKNHVSPSESVPAFAAIRPSSQVPVERVSIRGG